MSELDIISVISQVGFPIAISVYLIYERTKTFREIRDEDRLDRSAMMEIIKSNTVANTELKLVIQKLCEIVSVNNK